MSDRDKGPRRPEESEIREALRSLAAARPDPEYRERLLRAFMSGSVETASRDVTAPAADRAKIDARARRRPSWWPAPAGWVLAPAVLAALLLVFFVLNRGPAWSVLDVAGAGEIVVDGRPIAAGDRAALSRALGRHPNIDVPDGAELVLRSDVVLLDLPPGTRTTVPSTPGRWFGRDMTGTLDHGEVRIMTGDRFPGHRLRFTTADGITELTGTIVSVYKADPLTCVCVLEGTASVGANARDMEPIPAGMRKVLFSDGSPPEVAEIEPTHAAGLVAFAQKYERGWRTARESGEDSIPGSSR